MKTKLSIIVMSHLSDAQEEISMNITEQQRTNKKINFVKWLILKFNGDLTQEIDAQEMYKEFLIATV